MALLPLLWALRVLGAGGMPRGGLCLGYAGLGGATVGVAGLYPVVVEALVADVVVAVAAGVGVVDAGE